MDTTQYTSLTIFDASETALTPTNPHIIDAAIALHTSAAQLIRHIEGRLTSPTSRSLYIGMDIGQAKLSPRQFHAIMVARLGREPNEHDIEYGTPDPKCKHVQTFSRGATLLDEYLKPLLHVLDQADDAGIKISPLQAAWLTLMYGDHAIEKLDELITAHGSGEAIRRAMLPLMRQTANFEELL